MAASGESSSGGTVTPGEGNANVYANLARGRLSALCRVCLSFCLLGIPCQGMQERRQERQSLLTKRDARGPVCPFHCRFNVHA